MYYVTTYGDPIWMDLSTRSALNLESVEMRLLLGIERGQISDAATASTETSPFTTRIEYPVKSARRVSANIVKDSDWSHLCSKIDESVSYQE